MLLPNQDIEREQGLVGTANLFDLRQIKESQYRCHFARGATLPFLLIQREQIL